MEPLKDILTIYEDKEKILKYFLPLSSTRHLDEYEYVFILAYVFICSYCSCYLFYNST